MYSLFSPRKTLSGHSCPGQLDSTQSQLDDCLARNPCRTKCLILSHPPAQAVHARAIQVEGVLGRIPGRRGDVRHRHRLCAGACFMRRPSHCRPTIAASLPFHTRASRLTGQHYSTTASPQPCIERDPECSRKGQRLTRAFMCDADDAQRRRAVVGPARQLRCRGAAGGACTGRAGQRRRTLPAEKVGMLLWPDCVSVGGCSGVRLYLWRVTLECLRSHLIPVQRRMTMFLCVCRCE